MLAGQGEGVAPASPRWGRPPVGVGWRWLQAVGPAFNGALTRTIGGLPHEEVLQRILAGIAAEGLPARIVQVHHTADCAAIGYAGAGLSGSGLAIGMQSRGPR